MSRMNNSPSDCSVLGQDSAPSKQSAGAEARWRAREWEIPTWSISNYNFMLGDSKIEVVKDFSYLGVTFSYNGFFKSNENEIITKCNRSIFSLIKKSQKR